MPTIHSHSFVLESPEHSAALACWLAKQLSGQDLVLLEGELGAGKSFFASALVHALGVAESVPVTSPTFALMNEYHGRIPIVHADVYRLADPDELFELGLLEKLEAGAVAIVEWGNLIRSSCEHSYLNVFLEILGPDRRRAILAAEGSRPEAIVEAAKAMDIVELR
ncbi:MAG: tRNA (adenosine(37)-N6)-threonylcarbamoyltransferase complex ATPase subunit type 1 TsaE [Myxococcales bacterium]|nr:MAG: tRNA (adenosine(37)-N6)-threonylcarbamoyltransferase complex ATPase subunit type 1 TsaE [Myxococcales bacterium]